MSRKIWCFAVLLMLAGGFVFSLGYYAGKKSGIAEITEFVLAEKLKEQEQIDKVFMSVDAEL